MLSLFFCVLHDVILNFFRSIYFISFLVAEQLSELMKGSLHQRGKLRK
jgi:hypothetical protein